MSENALLREFAATRSEPAFTALVRQHVNLVFATALRQVGDRSLAEEISQDVFAALARKAGALGSFTTIAGWLYKATLLECRRRLRSELRRQRREEVAAALRTVAPEPESDLRSLVPLLDEAMLDLRESDRLAVMLRFLEEKPLREVGEILGVSEDAARKRVTKALEHLTEFFRQRGFAVSGVTATVPLFAAATHAAPAGLAAAVTTAVLTKPLAASGAGLTISKLIAMTTKTKLTTAAASALLIAAVISPVVLRDRARLKAEIGQLRSQLAEASAQQASAALPNVVVPPPAFGSTSRRRTPSLLATYERGAMTVEQIVAALQGAPGDVYQSTEGKLRRQALLAQLQTNEVRIALELAAQIPDLSQRQNVCEWLLERWVESDGAAALNYASKQPKGVLREGKINELTGRFAAHDPDAAIAWFREQTGGGAAAPDGRLVFYLGSGLARADFNKALSFVNGLPERTIRMKALEAVAQAAHDDTQRQAVLEVVRQLPDLNDQRAVLSGLAGGWAGRDPVAVAAWVETLGPEERQSAARTVFSNWVYHDTERAADFYVKNGDPIMAASHVIQAWAERDPTAAGEWLQRQPEGPGSDPARKMFAGLVKGIAPAVAMEWANAIQQEKSRRKAFYEVFMDWKGRDPSAANAFLAKCGWSAERLQELRQEVGP